MKRKATSLLLSLTLIMPAPCSPPTPAMTSVSLPSTSASAPQLYGHISRCDPLCPGRQLGLSHIQLIQLKRKPPHYTPLRSKFSLTPPAGDYDSSGHSYAASAISKGGQTYLPLVFVCEQFGLSYSYLFAEPADVCRIKDANAVLTDSQCAPPPTTLESRYNEYVKAFPSGLALPVAQHRSNDTARHLSLGDCPQTSCSICSLHAASPAASS